MTLPQIEIVTLLVLTVGAFVLDRWRFDLVALTSLFAAVVLGLVPTDKALEGFANPVVMTVATVLVLSAAIGRSGMVDLTLKAVSRFSWGPDMQIFVICSVCMVLSAFMNNIGALALLMPIVLAMGRKAGRSPSEMMMPLSFAALLGGTVTLIGTPSHLLISSVRQDATGQPYGMFDFFPVGAAICFFGLLYLTVGWRILPRDRRGAPLAEDQFKVEDYITEIRLIEGSTAIGSTIRQFEEQVDADFSVVGLLRDKVNEAAPSSRRVLRQDDVLIVQGDPMTIKSVVESTKSELVASKETDVELTSDEIEVVEAVIRAGSPLIGYTARQMGLRVRYGVNVLATRPTSSHRRGTRLSDTRFDEGDIIILQGEGANMPQVLEQLGCLPLAERKLQLGRKGNLYLPPVIMALAVIATITGLAPVHIAFLGGALLIALTRTMRLDDMYDAINAPVLVMLGALIPVAEAMGATGVTEIIARHLADAAHQVPGWAMLTLVLVTTMVVTPFLANAATVLLMGPIVASLAKMAGYSIDPFLMAVATGASTDFLTPVGHQANTLVMGPGGYKFTDYWRLGLPLSIMVVVVGVPAILYFWPLQP